MGNSIGGLFVNQRLDQGKGKGNGGAKSLSGDDVVRNGHALVCQDGMAHFGLERRVAGSGLAIEEAQGCQNAGSGTDGGKPFVLCESKALLFDQVVFAQMGRAGQASGEHEEVGCGKIRVFCQGIGLEANAMRGMNVFPSHDRCRRDLEKRKAGPDGLG